MTGPRVDTLVRGGKVVTASDIVETAVAIKGDKIAAMGPEALLPSADKVIDAGGRFVLPGLIDCHLHIGAEYDDWKTAPLAAAHTGLTTLLPFVTYDEGETLPKAVARLRDEAETCPQYLLLNDKEMARLGPFAKIGPPLRSSDGVNQAALWAGTEQGYVSTVASDHSPRVPAAKEAGRTNIFVDKEGKPIPFGAPSLETLVPLMWSEGVVNRGLPVTWMARVMAENPARIFGIYPRKGAVRVGADADLTIWDPAPSWTIQQKRHLGIAGFTPYEGWAAKGKPWMTLLRGQVVLNQNALEQKPGYGRFLP